MKKSSTPTDIKTSISSESLRLRENKVDRPAIKHNVEDEELVLVRGTYGFDNLRSSSQLKHAASHRNHKLEKWW